ncbi:Sialate O-acetylesterase domain [Dillenia turbinata]|uniref:Sialate O-acetylesterase domain n=1 Tax=Dillenia turbinata TaxID=194707 RepID=A0AAN8W478_9MAGN
MEKRDGNVPAASRPDPSILRQGADLNWVEACEPLHADIDVGKTWVGTRNGFCRCGSDERLGFWGCGVRALCD